MEIKDKDSLSILNPEGELRDTNIAAFLIISGLKLDSTRLEKKGNSEIIWFKITGKPIPEMERLAKTFFVQAIVNPNALFNQRKTLLDIVFQKYGIKPKYYNKDYSIVRGEIK